MSLARAQTVEDQPHAEPLIEGLRQRGRLFELILADLLGPRTILRRGLLPSQLVPMSHQNSDAPGFRAYAAELVLCPDGLWRVAGDLAARVGNDPIAQLLEAPGLAAFLPGLCRFLLGEPLRLASVPSRWLADPGALQDVVAHPHRWAIVDALRRGPAIGLTDMTMLERIALQDRVDAAPGRFTARLLVRGATVFVAMARTERGAWIAAGRDSARSHSSGVNLRPL